MEKYKIIDLTLEEDIIDLSEDKDDEYLFSSKNIKNSTCFKDILEKNNQYDFYKRNRASEEILHLTKLESKSFGSIMERIVIEKFNFSKRNSHQNDCTYKDKKIEIKSSRYWISKKENDAKFQHIELEYDFDYIIFCLLDFTEIKIYITSKQNLFLLKNKNILCKQGNQGYWAKFSEILKFIHPVRNLKDIDFYINYHH